MSFISPQPCSSSDGCCPETFDGYCLPDSTPIAIVIQESEITGWINISTGIFTPGAPPAGTTFCGSNNPSSIEPTDWQETDSALGASVLVTRPAEIGLKHFITGISGSFDVVPSANVVLELFDGVTSRYKVFVSESLSIVFFSPIRISTNTAASLFLSPGVMGAIGLISMIGYTSL